MRLRDPLRIMWDIAIFRFSRWRPSVCYKCGASQNRSVRKMADPAMRTTQWVTKQMRSTTLAAVVHSRTSRSFSAASRRSCASQCSFVATRSRIEASRCAAESLFCPVAAAAADDVFGSLPVTSLDTLKSKGKVFPYSLPSVGPGADPGVQAVSPHATWSESRHIPSSSLPLLSARPAFTFVAFTRWRYL